jgi:hypothetical protein
MKVTVRILSLGLMALENLVLLQAQKQPHYLQPFRRKSTHEYGTESKRQLAAELVAIQHLLQRPGIGITFAYKASTRQGSNLILNSVFRKTNNHRS